MRETVTKGKLGNVEFLDRRREVVRSFSPQSNGCESTLILTKTNHSFHCTPQANHSAIIFQNCDVVHHFFTTKVERKNVKLIKYLLHKRRPFHIRTVPVCINCYKLSYFDDDAVPYRSFKYPLEKNFWGGKVYKANKTCTQWSYNFNEEKLYSCLKRHLPLCIQTL